MDIVRSPAQPDVLVFNPMHDQIRPCCIPANVSEMLSIMDERGIRPGHDRIYFKSGPVSRFFRLFFLISGFLTRKNKTPLECWPALRFC